MTGQQPYHPANFPSSMRASDAQRDEVAAMVRAALSEGRLDLQELDDRLETVYVAKTHGDLARSIHDLVPAPPPTPHVPSAAPVPTSDKAITPALVLCGLFGLFGGHVFYTAGPTGLAWLRLALPFTGIAAPIAVGWWFLDLTLLVIGRYKDGNGRPITDWV